MSARTKVLVEQESGRFLRDVSPRWSCGQAEPVVLVPVVRLVPVAVRRPAVLAVVVPAPATQHASQGLGRHLFLALTDDDMDDISSAIALCVGAP